MIGERVLLDTSVVVRHFRKEGLLNDAFVAHDLYLPQVALGELYAGAKRALAPKIITSSSNHSYPQSPYWRAITRQLGDTVEFGQA